jgi:DNA processing protein
MPSERGKEWCRRFVLDLAAAVPEITIVSGLAYGIDIAAHKAAIEAGLPTIIIPAHGLDRIYPAVHRNIAVQALGKGGILTEYTTGTEPERYNFVARNRIVAGMADALVVVESKSRGGSLITAQMAQDYSRDVFALPGRFNDTISEGCNDLIKKQRAQLITSSEDFIQAMQWEQEHKKAIQTTMVDMLYDLNDKQRKIIDKLTESEEGLHVNQLVMELQIPYNEMVAELMMLELNGIAKGLPGGLWRRVEQ